MTIRLPTLSTMATNSHLSPLLGIILDCHIKCTNAAIQAVSAAYYNNWAVLLYQRFSDNAALRVYRRTVFMMLNRAETNIRMARIFRTALIPLQQTYSGFTHDTLPETRTS